ncbi:hypothetical protein ACWGLF_38655 [Streptomyces puniciscabiei]
MATEGVVHDPREYRAMTEEQRRTKSHQTGGQPVLDLSVGRVNENCTPCFNRHSVNVLPGLQRPRTPKAAEPTLSVTGRIQELPFKFRFTEANRVRDLLLDDGLGDAVWYLQRIGGVQRVLTACREPVSSAVCPRPSGGRGLARRLPVPPETPQLHAFAEALPELSYQSWGWCAAPDSAAGEPRFRP